MKRDELVSSLREIERLAATCLAGLNHPQVLKGTAIRQAKPVANPSLNFATPIRNFVKLYARDMSGPQKFALLVAYLTKGNSKRELPMTEVEKTWNRMKPLLGGKFNLAYTTRAKDNGWVDSPKRGHYVILAGWKGIFDG